MRWPVAVVVDAAVWAGWSAAVGWWHARLPVERLGHDGPVLRLHRWEQRRRYERWLRVRSWKDWLPDAGPWLGGLGKRRLPPGRGGRARFLAECRRAERTHCLIVAATPLFVLWNPAWLFGVMVVYAVVANLPCIAVQRYNRIRLRRAVDAARRRRSR